MRKIYLLLMLFLGCVGSASAARFEFANSDVTEGWMGMNTTESFKINIPSGGYNNGWAEEAITVQLSWLFDNQFAFCRADNNYDANNHWDSGWWRESTGIQNKSQYPNVFSVLNLRAGERVKVKMLNSNNPQSGTDAEKWAQCFVVDFSSNAFNNYPWGNYVYIGEWTQEFVMKEDGNLDLKVAKGTIIEEVEVISDFDKNNDGYNHFHNGMINTSKNANNEDNYVEYVDNHTNPVRWVHCGDKIRVTIPCETESRMPSGRKVKMGEPVVLFRGDLKPKDSPNKGITYNWGVQDQYNVNSNSLNCVITIEGFTGIQTDEGYWEGGSIIVILDRDMYTFTVPYKTTLPNGDRQFARWNFWQKEMAVKGYTYDFGTYKNTSGKRVATIGDARIDGATSQTTLTLDAPYKSLLAHDIKNDKFSPTNINPDGSGYKEPFVRYTNDMKGQNSYYHQETAGLVFIANVDWNTARGYNENAKRWAYPYGILSASYAGKPADGSASGDALVTSYADQQEVIGQWTDKDGNKHDYWRQNANGTRWVGLLKGGKMIVPELSKDDEVWMYISNFGSAQYYDKTTNQTVTPASSLAFYVTNARDAEGKVIGTANRVVIGASGWGPDINGKWGEKYFAAYHFYAREDGDMVFTIDGDQVYDLAKICYVKIQKKSDKGIIERTNELVSPTSSYEVIMYQKPDGSFDESLDNSAQLNLHESGKGQGKQHFEVLEVSGNLDKESIQTALSSFGNDNANRTGAYRQTNSSHTNEGRFRIATQGLRLMKDNKGVFNGPKFGSILVRGKDFDLQDEYCFDYADRTVSVGFLQTMNYPFTWNLKDILGRGQSGTLFDADLEQISNSEASLAAHIADPINNRGDQHQYNDSTVLWQAPNAGDTGYGLQNNKWNDLNNRLLSSGTQLYAGDQFIEEVAGLGFATMNQGQNLNGSINVSSAGVKIKAGNGYPTRIFLPGINKAGRLYVRGYKYNDGVGFKAYVKKGDALGYYKAALNPSDELIRISLPGEEAEVKPVFNYQGEMDFMNTTVLDEDENLVSITFEPDDVLSKGDETELVYSSGKKTVNNPANPYTSFIPLTGEWRDDGFGGYVYVITGEDNNIYMNDAEPQLIATYPNAPTGATNAIYDNNVEIASDYDGNEYADYIDLKGSYASNANRYLKVTVPKLEAGTGQFKLTVVASSNKSRLLNVYQEGSVVAQMVTQNTPMAKTATLQGSSDEATEIILGSANSGIQIYAVYVEEIASQSTGNDREPYLAYCDLSASDGGATLYLNDILIEEIAVSTDPKELNVIGWASESRDHLIDHNLTAYFNGKYYKDASVEGATSEPDVKTYIVVKDDSNDPYVRDTKTQLINGIRLTEITKPMMYTGSTINETGTAQTGCIIYWGHKDSDKELENKFKAKETVYLFVPAIHDYLNAAKITNAIENVNGFYLTTFRGNALGNSATDNANVDQNKVASMAGNVMVANLNGTSISGVSMEAINDNTNVHYVLSYKYKDGKGVQHPTADENTNKDYTERFVRVAASGASGNANTAYLVLKGSDVKKSTSAVNEGSLEIFFDGEENTDAIEEIALDKVAENGEDVFYTISGQRISKPTTTGIYVKNGKKVVVK